MVPVLVTKAYVGVEEQVPSVLTFALRWRLVVSLMSVERSPTHRTGD